MGNKEIIFHVGMSKTGTTSIQNFLKINFKLLKKEGVLFPVSARGGGQHLAIARYYKGVLRDRMPVDALIKELEAEKYKKAIISSEAMESISLDAMRSILKDFKKFNIKIIIYIRRQDKAIVSMYNELVKKNACSLSFDRFLEISNFKKILDFKTRLDMWAEVFGKENLIVRVFDRHQFFQNILEKDFLNSLGINSDLSHFSMPKVVNKSIGSGACHTVMLVNKNFDISIDHRSEYEKASLLALNIDQMMRMNDKELSEKWIYFKSKEQVLFFMDFFKDGNMYVEKEYLNGEQRFFDDYMYNDNEIMKFEDSRKALNMTISMVISKYQKQYGPIKGRARAIGVLWKSLVEDLK